MIKTLLNLCIVGVLALAGAAAVAQPSGQVQAVTPLTRDLGSLKTLTAQAAATVTSADQNGFNVERVICVFRTSTMTVASSATFKIQNKDAASSQYYDLIVSPSISASVATTVLAAGAGIPNVTNSTAGFPIAKTWRVSATVTGATAQVTGTIGCSVQ